MKENKTEKKEEVKQVGKKQLKILLKEELPLELISKATNVPVGQLELFNNSGL